MLHGLQPWHLVLLLIPVIGVTALALAIHKLTRRPSPEPEIPQEDEVVSGRLLDRETLERIGGRIWGRAVRRRYIPGNFPGPIKCVIHKQMLLPGQYFWETPLLDRETHEDTGDNFAICTACQPGDATEVNHA